MTEKQRDTGFKALTLGISIFGSVVGSYTAAKVQLATLDTRVAAVEKKADKLDEEKLDTARYNELAQRLVAFEAQNSTDHRQMLDVLLQLQATANRARR